MLKKGRIVLLDYTLDTKAGFIAQYGCYFITCERSKKPQTHQWLRGGGDMW